jgi:hypothetical protein
MKTRFLCFLIVVFSQNSCNQQKPVFLEGAWKVVQRQSITDGNVVNNFPGKTDLDVIKIWSGNRFMGVGRCKSGTTFTDEFSSGTFKLDGNKYEENVAYLFYKPWEGTTVKMSMIFRNDTLILTFPVDDKGQPDKNGASVEKYLKLDKLSEVKTGYLNQNPFGILMPLYLEKGIAATVEKFHSMVNGPEKDNYNWDRSQLEQLGWAIIERGNTEDAINIYKLNALMHSEDDEVYCTLGWAYQKTGDKQTSLDYFEKALKLNPKNTYALERLQKADKATAFWGLVGSATTNGWNGPDIPFNEVKNKKGIWDLKNVRLSDGEIKYRFSNDWRINFGNDKNGKLVSDGENIKVKAGNYDITLDLTDDSNPKNTISRQK